MFKKIYTAIGLMSGTSMDGVDLALIETDGFNLIKRKKFCYFKYDDKIKNSLRHLIYNTPTLSEIKLIENEFTILNAKIVNEFLAREKINRKKINFIGFHGHTIMHAPQHKMTWQIGNAELLAAQTGIDVVSNFRVRDVALGGQGAPLVPIYHFHLLHAQKKPCAVLNIGGVSNITLLKNNDENEIEAFDVCFGNAPFDDLVKQKLQKDFDEDGKIALSGKADLALCKSILQNEIFYKKPPKSFDRNDFLQILAPLQNLKIEDALASLAFILAQVILFNLDKNVKEIFICGGGAKNEAIMNELQKNLAPILVRKIEEIGFDGNAIEAEAFAFLAARSVKNLPISFQKTTGVSLADNCARVLPQQCFSSCGGVFYRA